MFKKSRRKIVAAIMSILTLLWVGTLCVIYFSSYIEVSSKNQEMLKLHAEQYVLGKPASDPFDPMKPLPNDGPHIDKNHFKLSTFYTVAISYDNRVIDIQNDKAAVYSDEELERAAKQVIDNSEQSGVLDSLIYYKVDKGGYILVSFMDNTIIRQSTNTLFRYTLIFGGVAIVALYFLAVFLAKKIVDPLEKNHHKQRQFISDAGHELKTPVSIVNANADLLSREIGDNQWLANIQYENERMGNLVEQLLELARTENITPQMDILNLSNLVTGDTLPFESVAFENGLVLKSQIKNDILIQGNKSQLSQLVSILVDNAIRHSKNGKEISIKLESSKNHAILSVINCANAIPQEQATKLFDRFYRADTVRNSESKHYGLGLSIAKAIVEAHHGTIDVQCFDGLVEFRVSLPKKQR